MTSDLVETLIDTHGEDGAAPTREEWEKILALPGDEAVLILNLLSSPLWRKFHTLKVRKDKLFL